MLVPDLKLSVSYLKYFNNDTVSNYNTKMQEGAACADLPAHVLLFHHKKHLEAAEHVEQVVPNKTIV